MEKMRRESTAIKKLKVQQEEEKVKLKETSLELDDKLASDTQKLTRKSNDLSDACKNCIILQGQIELKAKKTLRMDEEILCISQEIEEMQPGIQARKKMLEEFAEQALANND